MKKTGIVFAALMITMGAQAASIGFIGVGGDPSWTNTANWQGGIVPGTSGDAVDTAQFFGGTDIAEINTPITTGNRIDLLMRNTGKLTINADATTFRGINIGTTGSWIGGWGTFVKQTAGTTSASSIILGTDDANQGLYEVSGTGELVLSGNVLVGSNGWFNMVGSGAFTDLTNSTATLTVQTTGLLGFTLDASGVGTISVGNTFTVDSAHSKLVINATNYVGGSATFTLVDAASMSGSFAATNYTVTGLGVEGTDWSLTQGTDGDLVLNIPALLTEPFITSYEAAGTTSTLSFTGGILEDYVIKSTTQLEDPFTTSVTPTSVTVGSVAGDVVTTDANGLATALFDIVEPAEFYRVEAAP